MGIIDIGCNQFNRPVWFSNVWLIKNNNIIDTHKLDLCV
jgi:hypothetical protein